MNTMSYDELSAKSQNEIVQTAEWMISVLQSFRKYGDRGFFEEKYKCFLSYQWDFTAVYRFCKRNGISIKH